MKLQFQNQIKQGQKQRRNSWFPAPKDSNSSASPSLQIPSIPKSNLSLSLNNFSLSVSLDGKSPALHLDSTEAGGQRRVGGGDAGR
jgi:hypothetical protein